MSWPRALGLALGFAADRAFGDPARWHPVAGFGRVASSLELRTYADSRTAGAAHEAVLVGGAVALGALIEVVSTRSLSLAARPMNPLIEPPRRALARQACRDHRDPSSRAALWQVVTTAAATFVVLGGTTLAREAIAVAERLDANDLPGARTQVARIVGRRTDELTEHEVARAAVETVAENTSDAVVAPLFWGAVAGVPGLLGYRAINTMDAMIGYRSPRYRNFGWAAAKLDDLANWIPARLTAALVAVVRPGKAKDVWRIVRRDAAKHPSPNAGRVESAFAAALDVTLGGANTYHGVTENRGTLGDGASVESRDVHRAVRLTRAVSLAAVLVAVGISSFRAGRVPQ